MGNKMKILVLADGRSIHAERYVSEFRKQGHEIVLASLEPGRSVDVNLKRRTGAPFLDYFFSAREIRRLAKKYSPDIINPHFASGYGFAVAVSGVWSRWPTVLHCLGSDILRSPHKSPLHRARVKYALSRATVAMADSEYLKKKALEINGDSIIEVAPWGVEAEALDSFQIKIKKIGDRRKPPMILVPRPHQKIYNNVFILGALRDLLARREIIITFPAWGDDYEKFRRAARSEIDSGAVRFYKYLERKDYIEFMSGFDLYLSAAYYDSSPASLLEAMAAGLFPVVCNFPGADEWVSDRNGSVFDLDDGDSLRRAIKKWLNGLENAKKILTDNHQLIRKRAIFSENIRATARIMENII
jgi:glycosyltransferase involved in cell wall biosynthesis